MGRFGLIGYLGVSRGSSVYERTQGRTHRQVMDKFLDEMGTKVLDAG